MAQPPFPSPPISCKIPRMDMRPIFYVIGILLFTLALGMTVPMLADLSADNPDWKTFFLCIIFTAFFGGALILTNTSTTGFSLNVRQAFVLTTASWTVLAAFGALPFTLSGMKMSITDAIFESISGITTTGSTVITGLESVPPGILLWRAILQWLGGIGFIVMAMSILPFLKVGGMQLFRTESSESEKALPRAAQLATSIGLIYLALTVACMIGYALTGMHPFDAWAHAMATLSTGGFSTFDNSFAHFDNPGIEFVAIIFMILSGLPFVLYVKTVRGDWKALYRDSQVRWFLTIIGISIVTMVIFLIWKESMSFEQSLRRAAFNVASIITGTGFTMGDYGLWGGFAVSLLFFLTVVGGCSGSTTCGIKIFRFQILYSIVDAQIKQLLHPHGIFIPHYNGKAIPRDAATSVMSFFFLYALCFSVLAIALSYVGLDFLTAMSAAATTLSNVGPGLGQFIGPAGTFAPLPDSAKWMLCVGMLLGRLELFTVLVLLAPQFWRK